MNFTLGKLKYDILRQQWQALEVKQSVLKSTDEINLNHWDVCILCRPLRPLKL